jgi:hypothetical protein
MTCAKPIFKSRPSAIIGGTCFFTLAIYRRKSISASESGMVSLAFNLLAVISPDHLPCL